MKAKQIVKIIIDLFMYLLFVALMQEHLWSDGVHEWIGVALFELFILHNILNYRWYISLFRGKYNAYRTTLAIVNIALLVAMLGCIISSLLISGKVFAFLNLGGARFGRTLHLIATAWAFVLMSIHLGLHFAPFANKLCKWGLHPWVCRMIVITMAAYGIYVFVERAFYEELFYLTEYKFFDSTKSAAVYFYETLTMSAPFVALAHYGKKLMQIKKKRGKDESETH